MLDSLFGLLDPRSAAAQAFADHVALSVGPAPVPRWRVDVRIRGHWTACGLCYSPMAAFQEGVRQLALAGEIDLSVRRNGRLDPTVWCARSRTGTASLRIEEDPPARPFLLPAREATS